MHIMGAHCCHCPGRKRPHKDSTHTCPHIQRRQHSLGPAITWWQERSGQLLDIKPTWRREEILLPSASRDLCRTQILTPPLTFHKRKDVYGWDTSPALGMIGVLDGELWMSANGFKTRRNRAKWKCTAYLLSDVRHWKMSVMVAIQYRRCRYTEIFAQKKCTSSSDWAKYFIMGGRMVQWLAPLWHRFQPGVCVGTLKQESRLHPTQVMSQRAG